MSSDPRIFISYRRDDSSGYAGRLHDDLGNHFGTAQVFMDTQDIPGGAEFPPLLRARVEAAVVVLAVVGPGWNEAGPDGRRRLDDPANWVRRELSQALDLGKTVVPVLVHRARIDESGLPAPLARLADRHMAELSDAGWADDVRRLILLLEGLGLEPERLPVPFAEEPGAGRFETRDGWIVPTDAERTWSIIEHVLPRHGLRQTAFDDDVMRIEGGKALKSFLMGGFFGSDDTLPSAGKIRLRDRGLHSSIEVLLRERYGPRIMSSVKGRYRGLFDTIIEDLRDATGAAR